MHEYESMLKDTCPQPFPGGNFQQKGQRYRIAGHSLSVEFCSTAVAIIMTVILNLKVTQFHSVTKVDSNSNSANAKSAFSEHEPLTLKVVDNDDV